LVMILRIIFQRRIDMKEFRIKFGDDVLLEKGMNHVFGKNNWKRKDTYTVLIDEDWIETFSLRQLATFGVELEKV